MKTYTELLNEYKQMIQLGIDEYQALFSDEKPMGENRANDIQDIQEILDEEKNCELLKTRLMKALESFKTGVLFFKTGRSKLKKSIQQKLCHPGFSKDDFLVACIYELELKDQKPQNKASTQLEAMLEASEKESDSALARANQRICELSLQIQTLQKNIEFLEAENKKSRETNESLYHSIREDKKEGELNRECKRTYIPSENGEPENLSPSTSIHSSFNDLSQFFSEAKQSQGSTNNEVKPSFFSKIFN